MKQQEPTELAALRQQLQEHYARIVAAYRQKDVAADLALYAPQIDLEAFDGTRLRDRKTFASWTARDMASIEKLHRATFTIDRLERQGERVVVDATERWDYRFIDVAGEYGPSGRRYEVTWIQSNRAAYVSGGDGWLLQRTRSLEPSQLTVAGRPFLTLARRRARRANPTEAARQELQARYDQISRSIQDTVRTRDLGFVRPYIEKLGTPDWLYVDATGRPSGDRASVIAYWTGFLGLVVAAERIEDRVERVRLRGPDLAEAIVRFRYRYRLRDPEGKAHLKTSQGTERHLWVRHGCDWRWKKSTVLRSVDLLDGKPLSPETIPNWINAAR